MNDSYSQLQKIEARKSSLKHAVETLTSRRNSAAIVSRDYMRKVLAKLNSSGSDKDKYAANKCTEETVNEWEEFWDSKVSSKLAGDLMVARIWQAPNRRTIFWSSSGSELTPATSSLSSQRIPRSTKPFQA
jgi:hypothetical protein